MLGSPCRFDALWRCLLFPRISASAASPSFPGHPSDLHQAQQSISLIPNGISPHVPDRPGVGSLGNRVILAFQRHLPISHRLAELSRSTDFAPFLTPRT